MSSDVWPWIIAIGDVLGIAGIFFVLGLFSGHKLASKPANDLLVQEEAEEEADGA